MQHDSGYPSNWMPDDHPGAAQAGHHGGARRRRRRHHERAVRAQPADSARRVRAGAPHRLRQRREPAARARGRAARSDRRPARDGRVAPADRDPGARRKRPARGRRRDRRARRRRRRRAPAAGARVRRRDVPADRHASCADGPGIRVRPRARHRHRVRRRAGVVRDAHRSDRCAARRRPQHRRSLVVRAQGAARRAGDLVGRARRRIDDARAQPRQPRRPGLRLRDSRARPGRAEPAAGDLHAPRSSRRSIATSKSGSIACPGVQGAGLALYNPLTDNWGELRARRRPPAAEARGAGRRVVGSRQRELPSEPRRQARPRPALHRRRQRDDRERRRRERSVRPPLLQERRGSDRSALRPRPAGERQHLPHRRHRARCEVRRVRARPAGAADVLRAARADCRLQEPDDEAPRVPVALRARAAAGHEHAARAARAAGQAGARRCRSEPDGHERQDAAAAGRSLVRSAARRGEPRRAVRNRRAGARRDRTVRRDGLLAWRGARTRSACGWRSAPIAET